MDSFELVLQQLLVDGHQLLVEFDFLVRVVGGGAFGCFRGGAVACHVAHDFLDSGCPFGEHEGGVGRNIYGSYKSVHTYTQ